MNKMKKHIRLKSPDELMRSIWLSLVRDFRSSLDFPSFLRKHEKHLMNRDYKAFREEPFPAKMQAPVYVFKCLYQMENLFKRYIFESDPYTSDELDDNCINDFINFQTELASLKPLTHRAFLVIQGARKIIKEILGPFDREEFFASCAFGKRANVGVPYDKSYLDVKVQVLTGSAEHSRLLIEAIEKDKILYDMLVNCRENGVTPQIVDALNLVGVPKSWKASRVITPNTVLGAYFTYALGVMLEKRLRAVGLDIRKLQRIHGILAQKASIDRKLATGDMSKASDSFLSWLVNMCVPREWYRMLKLGRIGKVKYKKRGIQLSSFMAMGIGYTFTLQTLIFYALIKSMSKLTGIRGKISVYGDDLIYPSKLHPYVTAIFTDIGFKMNADKTFVTSHFRESCGSDFYHGVDVRPYQPEFVGGVLNSQRYESFCYKIYNGLRRRWSREEIPRTIHLLERTICAHSGRINQIPPSFPDYAGVKVDTPRKPGLIPWSRVQWNTKHQCFSFSYLREVGDSRLVGFVFPYYWNCMRRLSQNDSDDAWNPFVDPFDSTEIAWVSPRELPYRIRKEWKRLGISAKRKVATVKSKTLRKLLQQGSRTSVWA